jgi:hypothetical protein
MIKRWLASSTAVTALLLVRAAAAQTQYTAQPDSPEWLKDRRVTEGPGARAGDFEIHPGIGAEFGDDTNWFLRSSQPNVDNSPVINAVQLRITPSLYIETLQGQRVHEGGGFVPPPLMFRFGVNGTYYQIIKTEHDPQPSSEHNGDTQNGGSFGVGAQASLNILEGRPVGGGISATYGRVILPNSAAADANLSFNQDDITATGQLNLQPNSGTLDWHFGYTFATAIFEQAAGRPFTNLTHQAFTRGRWRFRPRSALIFDATADFFYYTNTLAAEQKGLVQSTPFRTRFGFSGLVTERFGVLALLGWGASFDRVLNPLMQQYDSLIANGEVKWYLAASPGIARATDLGLTLSSIALGYTRDFQNSYIGNFYGTDRGYLKFNYFFAGRALVSVEGGVGAIEYPHLFWVNPGRAETGRIVRTDAQANAGSPGTPGLGFTDVRADATVLGEYRFSDILALNSTFRYTQNFSDKQVETSPAAPTAGTHGFFGMGWQRFEILVGMRLFL